MKKFAATALVILASVFMGADLIHMLVGHSFNRNRTWFIKKAANNRTTVQADTFATGATIGGLDSDTLWSIRGTARDTSRAYPTWEALSSRISFNDSSSSDSVSIKIKMWVGSRSELGQINRSQAPSFGSAWNKNRYALFDSVTVSSSFPVWKIWTGTAMPNAGWFYLTVEGLAANKKAAGNSVVGTIITDGWSQLGN